MVSIPIRLKEERERLDMSQAEVAELTGQSRKSQIRYESGERSPDGPYFSRLATAGFDVLYILTGNRASPVLKQIKEIQTKHGAAIDLANHIAALSDAAMQAVGATQDETEFAPIPVYDAALAAGAGYENATEEVVDQLAFRRDWLARIKISPASAVLARAHGDSMSPAIQSGDMLLLDRAKNEVPVHARHDSDTRPPPIYALLDDGQARVKRIERPEDGLIMLLSDNPAFGPEILTGAKIETLNIIGKVVWWGHTVRE